MTCNTSAVAVCWSSASRVSVRSRAFSIAMTAWSAKVRTSSICLSANGSNRFRARLIVPSTAPSRSSGTPSTVRRPDATVSGSAYSGSARMSSTCTTLPSSATRAGDAGRERCGRPCTWGPRGDAEGFVLFLGKIPNALQANHPGIAVEFGPDDGRRDDVGRGPASAGEGQFWRAAAAVRHTGHGNSLATAAIRRCSVAPISFSAKLRPRSFRGTLPHRVSERVRRLSA